MCSDQSDKSMEVCSLQRSGNSVRCVIWHVAVDLKKSSLFDIARLLHMVMSWIKRLSPCTHTANTSPKKALGCFNTGAVSEEKLLHFLWWKFGRIIIIQEEASKKILQHSFLPIFLREHHSVVCRRATKMNMTSWPIEVKCSTVCSEMMGISWKEAAFFHILFQGKNPQPEKSKSHKTVGACNKIT